MHNLRRQIYIVLLFSIAFLIVSIDTIAWASPVAPMFLSIFAIVLMIGNYLEWHRNFVNRLDLQNELTNIRDEASDMERKLSKETREVNHRVTNLTARVDEMRNILIERGFEFPKYAHVSASGTLGEVTGSARAQLVYTGPRWKRYYSIAKYLILREFGFRD